MKRHPRPDTQSAEAARVGEELRDARLALGVSLEEMAEELRINRRYLAALEEGRVRDLPGIAYATGFVRSYSQILGLDAPEMVRRFREGAGVAAPAKDLVFPEPVPDRGVPAGAVIMLGAVLAVVGYAGWYYWSGSTRTAEEVPALPPRLEQSAREAGLPPLPEVTPPAATPPANTVPATVVPAPAPNGARPPQPSVAAPAQPAPGQNAPGQSASGQATPGQPAPVQPASPGGQPAPAAPAPPPLAQTPPQPAATTNRIVLRAKEDSWVQIRDAQTGRSVLSRVLPAGDTFEVPEGGTLVMTTGKVEGLTIEVDGTASAATNGLVGVRRNILLDPARMREAAAGQLPTR